MKHFQRYIIVAVAAFVLGWGSQSLMGITLRKAANSRHLSESSQQLQLLRAQVAAFQAKEKRFPRSARELYDRGLLDPLNPPYETLRHASRIVPRFDGEGGFVYLSASGRCYLNADVSREKFFRADWKLVLGPDLFPQGEIY